jgi:hypothetical protein
MLKLLCLVAALAIPISSIAQEANASSSTSSSSEPLKVAPVQPVFGMLKETTMGSERVSDFCSLDSPKMLPARGMV